MPHQQLRTEARQTLMWLDWYQCTSCETKWRGDVPCFLCEQPGELTTGCIVGAMCKH